MYVRVILHYFRIAVVNCKSEFYWYYDFYFACDIVLLYLRNVLIMYEDILCIDAEIFSKYGFIIDVINFFNSRKFFKAYYGFWVLYVFSFPSTGHWYIGSGHEKVGIRAWVFIADFFKLLIGVFLHYCGIRLSNVGSVIIASSTLRCVCFIVVFWFV